MTDSTYEGKHEDTTRPILGANVYGILKWVTLIALPAFATCYLTLAAIWGLPYPQEVAGTCTAIATLFGLLIGVSTKQYNKADTSDGRIYVDQDGGAYAEFTRPPLDKAGTTIKMDVKSI